MGTQRCQNHGPVRLLVPLLEFNPYLLAEENTCVRLPDNLSYVDGALIACGFGTAWEALTRIGVNGRDRMLVTGLGPVGLAAAMLGRALGVNEVNRGRYKR
jgi:D-arabinose 1-dehydrogenase-like Zn-dependent alcohol dehydrogenase